MSGSNKSEWVNPCDSPEHSRKRRQLMDQLWRKLYPEVKKFPIPKQFRDQQDELIQVVALYFSRNLCPGEAVTAKQPYDPTRASLKTWLSAYHKGRIKDLERNAAKERDKRESRYDRTGQYLHPETYLPARPGISNIEEVTRKWIEADPDGILSQTHLPNRPDITAQLVLLTQMPPRQSWQDVANKLNVNLKKLYPWYLRQCKPLLRRFGKENGYLDNGGI